MKKIALFLVASLMSLTAYAGVDYLQLNLSDGTATTIKIKGLTITVDNERLMLVNSEQKQLELDLADLESMQFTTSTSVERMEAALEEAVRIYGLDGMEEGSFDTLREAFDRLSPGIYIVVNNNGETFKIRIGK